MVMNMKKVNRQHRKTLLLILFLILVVLLTCLALSVYYYFLGIKLDNKNSVDVILENQQEVVIDDPIKKSSLSLIMGGDALIHSAVYVDAKISDNQYDFKGMLEYIKPITTQYDLAYYNQETILGGSELGLSTYPQFNSPYEVGDAFIDAGFNVISLANNHTLDNSYRKGDKLIVNSRNYWNSKDVMVNGSATSLEERNNIDIREKNGITYALLSYTTTTNGLTRKNNYHVNWYTEKTVKEDVELVRDKVDFLMVAMHWGTEYNTGVTNGQKKIAKYLASLDVDLVIGTHPHVIEPAEYIDDTFVIYSLGNFISGQIGIERLVGLMQKSQLVTNIEKHL